MSNPGGQACKRFCPRCAPPISADWPMRRTRPALRGAPLGRSFDERFRRNPEIPMQASEHLQCQRALPIEHFGAGSGRHQPIDFLQRRAMISLGSDGLDIHCPASRSFSRRCDRTEHVLANATETGREACARLYLPVSVDWGITPRHWILRPLRRSEFGRSADAGASRITGCRGVSRVQPRRGCNYGSAIFFSAITSRNRSG